MAITVQFSLNSERLYAIVTEHATGSAEMIPHYVFFSLPSQMPVFSSSVAALSALANAAPSPRTLT